MSSSPFFGLAETPGRIFGHFLPTGKYVGSSAFYWLSLRPRESVYLHFPADFQYIIFQTPARTVTIEGSVFVDGILLHFVSCLILSALALFLIRTIAHANSAIGIKTRNYIRSYVWIVAFSSPALLIYPLIRFFTIFWSFVAIQMGERGMVLQSNGVWILETGDVISDGVVSYRLLYLGSLLAYILIIFFVSLAVLRWQLRSIAASRGITLCAHCQYNLDSTTPSEVCPECGNPRDTKPKRSKLLMLIAIAGPLLVLAMWSSPYLLAILSRIIGDLFGPQWGYRIPV